MAKIKGWKKIVDKKDLVRWEHIKENGASKFMDVDRRFDKPTGQYIYLVLTPDPYHIKDYRRYNTKLPAIKYAISWMRKHPRS